MSFSVKIRYLGAIKTIAKKSEEIINIEINEPLKPGSDRHGVSGQSNSLYPDGGDEITIDSLLDHLCIIYGIEFSYYLRSADGSLPTHALIIVDGINLGHGNVLNRKIGKKSLTEIIVVPAIGGG